MSLIFRDNAYARTCEATVQAADADGIRLDATVFYPMGGGQPGDTGRLVCGGTSVPIADTRKGTAPTEVVHIPADGATPPAPGTPVTAELDWDRRYRLMRMHTALHLLCSLVPGAVTGGQIGESKSRLDFDISGDQVDKDALGASLNRLVAEDHPVRARWIDDADLDAQPDLVRTMSVMPPRDGDAVRLIEIEGVDLQPCGGTHVNSTSEIGGLRVGKVESKGKQNRRINIHLTTG
jgi:misacylated tRNA(Ala) deacylase